MPLIFFMGRRTVPPHEIEEEIMVRNYFAALAAFHSAIFARISSLMHQMKVKQQKEPRAASAGKPQTISLMPLMVEAA